MAYVACIINRWTANIHTDFALAKWFKYLFFTG